MEDEARKIIAQLAKDRRVEALVCNVARRHEPLGADLQDLCQMIYVFLLEYNPEKIVAMHQRGDLDFFLVRMIVNNLQSVNSRYYYIYRHFRSKTEDITGKDFIDEQ